MRSTILPLLFTLTSAHAATALVVMDEEVAECIGFLQAQETARLLSGEPYSPAFPDGDKELWHRIRATVHQEWVTAANPSFPALDDAAYAAEIARVFAEALPYASGLPPVLTDGEEPIDRDEYMTGYGKMCWQIAEEFSAS